MKESGAGKSAGEGMAAGEVKEQAVEQAHELRDATVEHVGAVTQDAKARALGVTHDVRRELETQGEDQARRLASSLRDAGRQLHDMADGAEPGPLSDGTRQLAGGTERLASRLEEGGIHGVADDLRAFARRRPGVFLLAAGATGFLLTRMLRHAQGIGAGPDPQPGREGSQSAPSQSAPSGAEARAVPPRVDR